MALQLKRCVVMAGVLAVLSVGASSTCAVAGDVSGPGSGPAVTPGSLTQRVALERPVLPPRWGVPAVVARATGLADAVALPSGGVLAVSGYDAMVLWRRTPSLRRDVAYRAPALGQLAVASTYGARSFGVPLLLSRPGRSTLLLAAGGDADGNAVAVLSIQTRATTAGIRTGASFLNGPLGVTNEVRAAVVLSDGHVRSCIDQAGYEGPVVVLLSLDEALRADGVGTEGSWIVPGLQSCVGIGVDGAGRLLLAGTTRDAEGHRTLGVVRLGRDGVLDTSFGEGGRFTLDRGAVPGWSAGLPLVPWSGRL